MKKPLHTMPQERYAVRHRRMDDVYRPEPLKTMEPVSVRHAPARHHKSGTFARNAVAVAMVATFMVSSVGITYGKLPGTGAFFADTETSGFNQFVANLLDFAANVTSGNNSKIFPDNAAVEVTLSVTPADGSVETNYRVTVEQTGGNSNLCNALQVSAPALDGPPASGSLLSLSGVLSTDNSVTLFISLPGPVEDVAVDDECNFDVVFRGWNALVDENTGYTDEERVAVTIIDPPLEEPLSATVSTEGAVASFTNIIETANQEIIESDEPEDEPITEEASEEETKEKTNEEPAEVVEEESVGEEAIVEEETTEESEPVEEEVVEETPLEETAAEEPPVEEEVVETPPVEEPTVEEPPAEEGAETAPVSE